MNKKKSGNIKGIVVALKANFLIVDIYYQDFKDESLDQFSENITLLLSKSNSTSGKFFVNSCC